MDQVELVAAWWRFYQALVDPSSPRGDDEFSAFTAVDEAVEEADANVVGLLIALADSAPSGSEVAAIDDEVLVGALAYLGAGPIEDLLRVHAERFVSEVETAAEANERFRIALRCVWYGDTDVQIVQRLRRFGDEL